MPLHRIEVAIVVQEDFRRRGIAAFLLRHLAKVAAQQGIVGFTADVLSDNSAMLDAFRKIAVPIEVQSKTGITGIRFCLSDVKRT